MSQKIVAFVDHEIGFRLLTKLILLSSHGDLDLLAVVTTEDNGHAWWPGVSSLCLEEGIPLFIYRVPFTATLVFEEIDWYFLLSWKYILPEVLVNHPRKSVVNLHYSLLPEYRGVYPVNWAIIDGRSITGVSYHLVDKKIDSGMVVCQKRAPVFMSDTARTLQLRLDDVAYGLFDSLLAWVGCADLEGGFSARNENTKQSYRSLNKFNEKCEIDLDQSYRGADLLNILRGLTFFSDSKNAYFIDPTTGKRVYVSINLNVEE